MKQLYNANLIANFKFDNNEHNKWTSIDTLKEIDIDEFSENTYAKKMSY